MHRHKVGYIIYFYNITAAKGGPSLSQLPTCDSEIVDTLSRKVTYRFLYIYKL